MQCLRISEFVWGRYDFRKLDFWTKKSPNPNLLRVFWSFPKWIIWFNFWVISWGLRWSHSVYALRKKVRVLREEKRRGEKRRKEKKVQERKGSLRGFHRGWSLWGMWDIFCWVNSPTHQFISVQWNWGFISC